MGQNFHSDVIEEKIEPTYVINTKGVKITSPLYERLAVSSESCS